MPDAGRAEHAAGLQMNVEARRMNVAAHYVRKARGDMRFVRSLVRREPHVSVDAKHRTARRARVGNQLWADLPEPRSEVGDECEHRLTNVAFVARTIRLEPFASVVAPQFLQEAEQVTAEMRFLHRRQSFLPSSRPNEKIGGAVATFWIRIGSSRDILPGFPCRIVDPSAGQQSLSSAGDRLSLRGHFQRPLAIDVDDLPIIVITLAPMPLVPTARLLDTPWWIPWGLSNRVPGWSSASNIVPSSTSSTLFFLLWTFV